MPGEWMVKVAVVRCLVFYTSSIAFNQTNLVRVVKKRNGKATKKRRGKAKKWELVTDAQEASITTAYENVKTITGSLGGNAEGGPIYGELIKASLQHVINKMVAVQHFDKNSRFIDVGSGLGKPNIHVGLYPGVALSVGVEVVENRRNASIANMDYIFQNKKIKEMPKVILCNGDITEAESFDPFTHVYMFDIGFPDYLFRHLAKIFNESECKYLVCFHGPKLMIDHYRFNMVLQDSVATTMHGSGEGHTSYLYQRTPKAGKTDGGSSSSASTLSVKCDPMFEEAVRLVTEGDQAVKDWTTRQIAAFHNSGRPTRNKFAVVKYDPETGK